MSTGTALVALGSNLDEPARHVRAGIAAIAGLPETRLLRASSLYRSAPVGYREQPDFVNAVAEIETGLAPRELLRALLDIERSQGRVREMPNGPRTLDLDIIAYGGQVIHEAGLDVPHPRMGDRAFVLVPLAEIAPDAMIPLHGRVRDLVAHVDAKSVVRLEERT